MADDNLTRKLAAILYADVAGYSRLTGADEEATHRALRDSFDAVTGVIERHGGRVLHYAGDAILAEFASVVVALTAAIDIQRNLAARNRGIADDHRLAFRIGVNLGDVIVDRDELYGDGVNVAARLESLAEPGGICISRKVLDEVRGKLDVGFEFRGEQAVKNIETAIPVYRVLMDPAAAGTVIGETRARPRGRQRTAAAIALAAAVVAAVGVGFWRPWEPPPPPATPTVAASGKPTVAVLPFTNMGGDREQAYFSDGMAEDLITDLSKVSGLYVVSRNSSFALRGQAGNLRDIAKTLDARYLVEGSVRRVGGRVRINAQLTDAETGRQIWADRYDRDYKDVFALQDEVLGRIVGALRVTLTPGEQQRLARRGTRNPEAYDWYLKGLQQESFFSREANRESRRYFERAIESDPSFASAYGHLAQAYSLAVENHWTDETEEFSRKAFTLARQAVALDNESPQAHWALGRIASRPPIADLDLALASLKRVIELDPNYGDGYAFYANTLNYVGQAREAIPLVRQAMRINPRYPFWYVFVLGQAQFLLEDFAAAIPNFKLASERNPTVTWPHRFLLASYGHLGMMEDAEWEKSELESLGQPLTIRAVRERMPFQYPPYVKLFLDGLRKAGVPEE